MLFYDFEVFKCNWLVVIKDAVRNKTHTFIDDPQGLTNFYQEHKDNIWVGYNSRHYDQWILKAILAGLSPQRMNKHIIEKKKHGALFSTLLKGIQLYNYDTMSSFHGLKQLEGFMGESIKETSVPFDIDRALTEQEIQEVVDYCRHDVEQTQKVFELTIEEFTSQLALLKAFNLPMEHIGKTQTQLAAIILGASKKTHNDEFDLIIPDTIRIEKYRHILDWYKNPANINYNNVLEVEVAGVPHTFAWGGLHGAIPKYSGKGIFINADVASYYPSLMIEYDFASRNIKNPKKYEEIYRERLRLKAAKDPKQLPYKLALNKAYGATKDKYNALYDPRQANNVCVTGQLMLLDLIEKLEPVAQLIQSNTDGVLIKIDSMDDFPRVKEICGEWENRTRMTLEFDIFTEVHQKDVNNYIIVEEGGGYKSKGAYVKKLSKLDNDLPIVNKAVVDYLVRGIPVEQTINECDDLIEFQKIVKVSSKYLYGMHGDKRLNERVLRVFASRSLNDAGVFKVKLKPLKKTDGFTVNENMLHEVPEKIGNTPPKCFIMNENIVGVKVPRKLDKQYYIDVAKDRINKFKGVKSNGKDRR